MMNNIALQLVETYHILLCLHQEGLGHNRDLKLLTRWESFLIAPFHANSTPSLAALADLARFWKHNYSLCASRDVPLKLCAILTTAEEILGLRLLPEEAQEENEDTCVCVVCDHSSSCQLSFISFLLCACVVYSYDRRTH